VTAVAQKLALALCQAHPDVMIAPNLRQYLADDCLGGADARGGSGICAQLHTIAYIPQVPRLGFDREIVGR
jgi:hypothetical protein